MTGLAAECLCFAFHGMFLIFVSIVPSRRMMASELKWVLVGKQSQLLRSQLEKHPASPGHPSPPCSYHLWSGCIPTTPFIQIHERQYWKCNNSSKFFSDKRDQSKRRLSAICEKVWKKKFPQIMSVFLAKQSGFHICVVWWTDMMSIKIKGPLNLIDSYLCPVD